MKDPDKLRCARLTTNTRLDIEESLKSAADRIDVSTSDLIHRILEREIEFIDSLQHISDFRRRA